MKKIIAMLLMLSSMVLAFNGSGKFKIVALPDTQYYSRDEPETFRGQIDWIMANADSENIKFVSHLGDIVHNPNETQWANAIDAMSPLLSNTIPYSVCIGNHDYDDDANPGRKMVYSRSAGNPRLSQIYTENFGASRYEGASWYGGTDRIGTSHYQIFEAGGLQWLHLNLEYSPEHESLKWAQDVMARYPDLPVIYSSHSFMRENNLFSSASQWKNFMINNDQIILAMCGHIIEGDKGYSHVIYNKENKFGNPVKILLSDFQGEDNGGGHMNIIEFDLDNNKLNFKVFSSKTGTYRQGDEFNQSIDFNFAQRLTNFSRREKINSVQGINIYVDEYSSGNDPSEVNVHSPEGQSTDQIKVLEYEYPDGITDIITEYDADTGEPVYETESISNRGDYHLTIGQTYRDDALSGVLIASVAEDGRQNTDSIYPKYHTVGVDTSSRGDFWIAVSSTSRDFMVPEIPGVQPPQEGHDSGGSEDNVNVSAMYFPFELGWIGGYGQSIRNGNPVYYFVGSEGLTIDNDFTRRDGGALSNYNLWQYENTDFMPDLVVQKPQPTSGTPRWNGGWLKDDDSLSTDGDRCIWEFKIDGVNSLEDGLLMVCGGKNEDNYAIASPHPDGRGWQIAVSDNGSGGQNTEEDPFACVYVPFATENLIAGRITGRAGILNKAGDFKVTRIDKGRHTLEIYKDRANGVKYTPEEGSLLISSELEWYNDDDFQVYQPMGDHWVIQTRDLPEANPADSTQAQYSFIFMPFDRPIVSPGGKRYFNKSGLLAGTFETSWDQEKEIANVHRLNSSFGYDAGYHNKGLYYMSINGYTPAGIAREDGATFASVMQSLANDSDGLGDYVPTATVSSKCRVVISKPNAVYGNNKGNASFASFWIPADSGYTVGTIDSAGTARFKAGSDYSLSLMNDTSGRTKMVFEDITPADSVLIAMAESYANNGTAAIRNLEDGWEITTRINVSPIDEHSLRWVNYVAFPFNARNGTKVARVLADGSVDQSSEPVSIVRTGVGTYEVELTEADADTGALLLVCNEGSDEFGAANAVPCYEPSEDGQKFVVKTFEISEPRAAIDCGFNMVYVPFVIDTTDAKALGSFSKSWNKTSDNVDFEPHWDYNNDEVVNAADLVNFAQNWLK